MTNFRFGPNAVVHFSKWRKFQFALCLLPKCMTGVLKLDVCCHRLEDIVWPSGNFDVLKKWSSVPHTGITGQGTSKRQHVQKCWRGDSCASSGILLRLRKEENRAEYDSKGLEATGKKLGVCAKVDLAKPTMHFQADFSVLAIQSPLALWSPAKPHKKSVLNTTEDFLISFGLFVLRCYLFVSF